MMDSCEELLSEARKDLETAEQMLLRTYPVVEDPKLMLAVAGDIYAALGSTMKAFLIFQASKASKDCPEGAEEDADFRKIFATFRKGSPQSGFEDDDFRLVEALYKVMKDHKESPVEFTRKDKFVICDENYDYEVLSVDDMKKYLFRARLFVDKAVKAISGEQGAKDD